jgi:L-alanine-DL-glutamate epimerase-like enolase superfamily enzyme
VVRGGMLKVPGGPGLGLSLSEDFLRKNIMPGETYWS